MQSYIRSLEADPRLKESLGNEEVTQPDMNKSILGENLVEDLKKITRRVNVKIEAKEEQMSLISIDE